MSKRRKSGATGAMLDLWRPPQQAGDPIGCVATTFTFAPGLFDEQCLARFLEIESEPHREDLAFLLERESRLSGVYAGVLVDHTQAGVEHSLRWDVVPVRIVGGRQHAKLSLLAWTTHVRIIVTSANLTDPGYRSNYEVASTIDLTPQEADLQALEESLDFLGSLLAFVPGASASLPAVQRSDEFLERVRKQTRLWTSGRRRSAVRQHLVFTMPENGRRVPARSSLNEAVRLCRKRGGSPDEAWIASPFFDSDSETSAATAALCKLLARGTDRHLCFCVPAIRDETAAVPRLAAPRALVDTPPRYSASVSVELLPDHDGDRNLRPWHAKMLALKGDRYSALMVGSSNFTRAGLGVGGRRNTEANLLTLVDYVEFSRDSGELDALWPEMEQVDDAEAAEWEGGRPERDEEERASGQPAPPGFLSAVFRAGRAQQLVLYLDPVGLPYSWSILASGRDGHEILSSSTWEQSGRRSIVALPWSAPQPPEKLLVRWEDLEAFLPLNVEDRHELPPPAQLDQMSADDMLGILAATDPSAAFRAWAKSREHSTGFDDDLDSATPIDLDPLRRFDLQATFLHRVRRRARVLAQLRANLQRSAWGRQALEWRLRGFVGVQAVAERLVRDVATANEEADEALLTLADFLIVLREVDYEPAEGALSRTEFHEVYDTFLRELARKLGREVEAHRRLLSEEPAEFWKRVVKRCLA